MSAFPIAVLGPDGLLPAQMQSASNAPYSRSFDWRAINPESSHSFVSPAAPHKTKTGT